VSTDSTSGPPSTATPTTDVNGAGNKNPNMVGGLFMGGAAVLAMAMA
jgi:hypothetical protein